MTRSGGACGRPAGWGTDHPKIDRCKLHGGCTPNHRQHASQEIAKREIARLGQEMGLGTRELQTNPADALLHTLFVAQYDAAFLEVLVNELPAHPTPPTGEGDGELAGNPGVYGSTFHLTGLPTGEAKPHVLWQMHEAAQKRLSDVAVACLKAKLDERKFALSQVRAAQTAESHKALCIALGHNPTDPDVRKAMRASLMIATGGE